MDEKTKKKIRANAKDILKVICKNLCANEIGVLISFDNDSRLPLSYVCVAFNDATFSIMNACMKEDDITSMKPLHLPLKYENSLCHFMLMYDNGFMTMNIHNFADDIGVDADELESDIVEMICQHLNEGYRLIVHSLFHRQDNVSTLNISLEEILIQADLEGDI